MISSTCRRNVAKSFARNCSLAEMKLLTSNMLDSVNSNAVRVMWRGNPLSSEGLF